jgi:phage terminase large subunit-like protein
MKNKTVKKIGNQEPTFEVIQPFIKSRFSELDKLVKILSVKLLPYQENLLNKILGIDDAGLFVHQKFGISLSRRNGKNYMIALRELFGCIILSENILHTAHLVSSASVGFEMCINIVNNSKLKHLIKKVNKGSGRQEIVFSNDKYIRFQTRTKTNQLGTGYDLLVIDEAQEYEADQETALKYVVSAQENPQTIMIGTPTTEYSNGTVFSDFKQSITNNEIPYQGWAEWGVKEQADPYDVEKWYLTNPAIGYHLSERDIYAEIGNNELDFNIQRLGYWVSWNIKSYFEKALWELTTLDKIPPLEKGRFFGVKFSPDSLKYSLSVAAKIKDSDKIFTETLLNKHTQDGFEYLINFLLERKNQISQVIIDGKGYQKTLQRKLTAEGFPKHKIILPTLGEFIQANANFEQEIYNKNLKHISQPSVVQAFNHLAKRQIGSAGGFGFKSLNENIDITLIDSIILSCYYAKENKLIEIKKYIDY